MSIRISGRQGEQIMTVHEAAANQGAVNSRYGAGYARPKMGTRRRSRVLALRGGHAALAVRTCLRVIRRQTGLLASCLALGVALQASCSSNSEEPMAQAAPTPKSVLFVGNSFSMVHGGLEVHFKALASSMQKPRDIAVQRSAQEGATLQTLRLDPAVLQSIRAGGHDVVVLQDDIPEYGGPTADLFKEQVRWFNQEVRAKNGRVVLFMAWPYERLNWVSLATVAAAHKTIGAELDIPVAPVGLAFDASRTERPGLEMLGQDREHETVHGIYLAACAIYATIFQESPEGARYAPPGVSPDEAAFLQRVAWQTVSKWKTSGSSR
jgi:hypothetical protein